jgi:tetratricopeptide (TPR) repeat protein
LYISQLLRGELASALETAEAFLREAESEGRPTEAAAANRLLGMAFLYRGALDNAQAHLSEALRLHDPERDRDAKFRFSADTGAAAASYLAQTKWYLGEINQAIELIEESGLRAFESGHAPTLALIYHLRGMFDMHRGNATNALRVSEAFSKSPKSIRWPSIAVKDWYTPVGPALGSATAKRVLRNLRE